MDLSYAQSKIRTIPDFPKPGILFRDITPVLADPKAFQSVVSWYAAAIAVHKPDIVAGIDARGFIFGAAAAAELGLGFVPVRKAGKLPGRVVHCDFKLEYGTATLEIHEDAVESGARVAIVDDLLATGGTAEAAANIFTSIGAKTVCLAFLIELKDLGGRQNLRPPVMTGFQF